MQNIKSLLRNLIYQIKCYFFPYNKLTIHALPRTWIDRDVLMFHAMFQILVDFIELEKPFTEYDSKEYSKKGRFTDIKKMWEFYEKYYGDNINVYSVWGDKHCDWDDEYYRASILTWLNTARHYKKEQLYLYELYKTYLIKSDELTKLPIDINYRETEEKLLQAEKDIIPRLLAIRNTLWT